MDWLLELWQFDFMRHSIFAAVLISLTVGLIGSLVIINQLTFYSGGIAHASYGGIGIAYYFGLAIMPVTLIFAVLMTFLFSWVYQQGKHKQEAWVALIWSLGMSLGVLLISLSPGYQTGAMSYLFGNILLIDRSSLILMAVISFLVVVIVLSQFRNFMNLSYNAKLAATQGINTHRLMHLLMLCVALIVVMSVQLVGLILLLALLTIPAYSAQRISHSMSGMILISILLSLFYTLGGLLLAYQWDWLASTSIIGLAAIGLLIIEAIRWLRSV